MFFGYSLGVPQYIRVTKFPTGGAAPMEDVKLLLQLAGAMVDWPNIILVSQSVDMMPWGAHVDCRGEFQRIEDEDVYPKDEVDELPKLEAQTRTVEARKPRKGGS